ncbi:tetratricopeptide repeat protein, partial [Bacillus cereus]
VLRSIGLVFNLQEQTKLRVFAFIVKRFRVFVRRFNNHETALSTLNRAYKIIIHEQISGILRVSLLANLGIVHGRLSEYYSAINFLEEAIEQNEQTRTHYKAGEIYMALGICNMELQRFDQAKKQMKKLLNFQAK